MPYYTRVLSKDDEFPSFDELAQLIRAEHPDYKLSIESGDEEEWESLLLSGNDEVEVAVLERNPVYDGSIGQDEIADFLEDLQDCRPESGAQWLTDYLAEVKTIYSFQHLQGSETVDGGNVLHALRSLLWERGDAIIQADGEGFTNEDGYHIVWQFSDSVSGPWNMGVYKDDLWHHFRMDLGDPDHRAAFLAGEVPDDLTAIHTSGPRG
ncbi:MAG TPA: hypothetical protein VN776_01575 [Terracidiphilus sp.]|nr:hypothetical protein [Terracidiphilus sp.]HYW84986.1 hypothetical protein [Spirochaetia bacterium]